MKLCVIPGDGIGQEVVPVAVCALQKLLPALQVIEADAGWECFQRTGQSVPEATLLAMREAGAGLFGAVSSPLGPVEGYRSAILTLRQQLNLSVNLRPVRSWPRLSARSDVDMLILRENSECLYVGLERLVAPGSAVAERHVSAAASRLLAERAVEVARLRGARRITLVHKANILPLTCGLFRDSCRDVLAATGLQDLVDERLVDAAALQLMQSPESFDLILTTNLFGDILSDLAAYWCGGLGMAPSLNWGQGLALAEPVHGSAPDIAGTGRANPIAALLSAALLLRFHWQKEVEAARLEEAVRRTLLELDARELGAETTATTARMVMEYLES